MGPGIFLVIIFFTMYLLHFLKDKEKGIEEDQKTQKEEEGAERQRQRENLSYAGTLSKWHRRSKGSISCVQTVLKLQVQSFEFHIVCGVCVYSFTYKCLYLFSY